MNKTRAKLLMTATMLMLSILLLVGASMAWFTMSTAPEISGMKVTLFTDRALLVAEHDPETNTYKEFTQSIDLGEMLSHYAPLKPVSTADGVHWFLPTYNGGDGTLNAPADFVLDETLEHANVLVYNKTQNSDGSYTYTEMSQNEYFEANNKGYYIYCDFWLMTQYEEGCRVTLSVPDNSKSALESWERDESHEHGAKYGSYALAAYQKEEGKNEIYSIDNNAQTALRVGFLIEDPDTQTSRFVIYEPNADQRSDYIYKPNGIEYYINGFNLIANDKYVEGQTAEPMFKNFINNAYIPTRPIGVTTVDGKKVGSLANIDPDNLIIQMAGQWDDTSLRRKVLAGESPNSEDVMTFGKFVKQSSSLVYDPILNIHDFNKTQVDMGLASDTLIVTLKGRDADGTTHPQKIRMFIWLEGQDADCWNDIASGSFVVNLEFAAQS